MSNRFVIDTVGFLNYFNIFFEEKNILSIQVRRAIDKCLDPFLNNYKLIIPSIVLIEAIHKKLTTEELSQKFYWEIFKPLIELEDVEIKALTIDTLTFFPTVDTISNLELHDKIVFSSAYELDCPLITNDPKIITANHRLSNKKQIIF